MEEIQQHEWVSVLENKYQVCKHTYKATAKMQTEIKQRPILFSTHMVNAILEGRKIMTRRKLKIQPEPPRGIYSESDAIPILKENGDDLLLRFNWKTEKYYPKIFQDASFFDGKGRCPYGKVGDILWVRETWMYNDDLNQPYAYKADYNEEHQKHMKGHRKPSIFMPKEACRLFLRITDIRVERLQDISEEDATAEGSPSEVHVYGLHPLKPKSKPKWYAGTTPVPPKEGFRHLWESINGPGSWNANPFVWVVKFEKIDKPE
jgi:hypothetical protein